MVLGVNCLPRQFWLSSANILSTYLYTTTIMCSAFGMCSFIVFGMCWPKLVYESDEMENVCEISAKDLWKHHSPAIYYLELLEFPAGVKFAALVFIGAAGFTFFLVLLCRFKGHFSAHSFSKWSCMLSDLSFKIEKIL